MSDAESTNDRHQILQSEVKEFLSKQLKAQQSVNETNYMIGCLEDMLLKVRIIYDLQYLIYKK